MLTALSNGVSGMQQFQTSLSVIGNNIANSNTTGYKSARTDFADALSETLQTAAPATSTTRSTAAVQVGTGVATVDTQNDFTQGSVNATGIQSDLAISGNGYFVVTDAISKNTFVTRAGDFRVDSKGYLTTSKGLHVQGMDSVTNTIGDILIDVQGQPAVDPLPTYADYSIDSQGIVNVKLSDGTTFARAQVLLQNFTNPQALIKQGDNLYSYNSLDAGPLTAPAIAGTNGLGVIAPESLEASNVDLTSEFANMITSQRAFQANARVITTSDEILQEIVGLKR